MKNYTCTIKEIGKKVHLEFYQDGEKFGERKSTKPRESFQAFTVEIKKDGQSRLLAVGKLATCESRTKSMNQYYQRDNTGEKAITVLI